MAKATIKGGELVMTKNHEGINAQASFSTVLSSGTLGFIGISLGISKEYTTYYDIGCHR